MAYEDLFHGLLRCEREEDVIETLGEWGLDAYSDSDWHPYGGFDNNYGMIGAQQAEPLSALSEKVINAIDAILMRECLKRNIDPEGKDAPRDMYKAAEVFFELPSGNLAKVTTAKRTQLAEENIHLILTGQMPRDGNPCILVVDTGEGQYPVDFQNTFLSLTRGNKKRIAFVQGRYNMGGTGCLMFSGPRYNFQLIASRRNFELPGIRDSKWGFTLVRRRPPLRNEKNSRFEYLAPGGNIIEMDFDEVKVLPGEDYVPYLIPIRTGSIIKLYEYQLPGAARTLATADFYRAMSTRLWHLVLPVRITETRQYKGHTLQSTLSGMYIRLEDDRGDVLEDGFPCSFSLNIPEIGVVTGQICLFKKEAEVSRWISSREAVIFTVNGQSHGFFPNDIFRRGSVKLNWIRRSLLINVDCSKLNPAVLERLFMTSRDRLRGGPECGVLETALEDFLKKHEGLRYWNEKRHQELIAEQFHEDSSVIKDLFERLIANSPMLAALLGYGNKVRLSEPGKQSEEQFRGRRFPTFLKLEKEPDEGIFVKQCPQNSFCRLRLLTDAENDYLDRAYEPGRLIIKPENLVKSTSLYNGRLEISLQPDQDYPVGRQFEIRVMLTSPEAIDGYFKVNFALQITEPIRPQTRKPTERTEPKISYSALPEIHEIYRNQWGEAYEITTEQDMVTIIKDDGKTSAFVNMDNRFFQSYLYQNAARKEKITNLYKLSATVVGLSLHELVEDGILEDEYRRKVASQLGKVLLPVVDGLGDLKASLE